MLMLASMTYLILLSPELMTEQNTSEEKQFILVCNYVTICSFIFSI